MANGTCLEYLVTVLFPARPEAGMPVAPLSLYCRLWGLHLGSTVILAQV